MIRMSRPHRRLSRRHVTTRFRYDRLALLWALGCSRSSVGGIVSSANSCNNGGPLLRALGLGAEEFDAVGRAVPALSSSAFISSRRILSPLCWASGADQSRLISRVLDCVDGVWDAGRCSGSVLLIGRRACIAERPIWGSCREGHAGYTERARSIKSHARGKRRWKVERANWRCSQHTRCRLRC